MKPEPDQPESIQAVDISGTDLENLIAQRPPMVMVSQLVAVGRHYAETRFRIPENTCFTEGNRLSEAGLVENIAQTIGAGSGYRRRREGKELQGGFLAAVKQLRIIYLPQSGDEIRTEVRFENEALDFKIFRGRTWLKSELIAECEMRIFIPDNQED